MKCKTGLQSDFHFLKVLCLCFIEFVKSTIWSRCTKYHRFSEILHENSNSMIKTILNKKLNIYVMNRIKSAVKSTKLPQKFAIASQMSTPIVTKISNVRYFFIESHKLIVQKNRIFTRSRWYESNVDVNCH